MAVPNGMLVALTGGLGRVLGLRYVVGRVAGRVALEQRWDCSLLTAE